MTKADFDKAQEVNEQIEDLQGNMKIILDEGSDFYMGFEHKILGDVSHAEMKELLGSKYDAICRKALQDIKDEFTSAMNTKLAIFNAI